MTPKRVVICEQCGHPNEVELPRAVTVAEPVEEPPLRRRRGGPQVPVVAEPADEDDEDFR